MDERQGTFLPLYEAKMIQAYDHRAASVILAEGNWVRQGQTEPTTQVAHQNPEFVVQPRWWVEEAAVIDGAKTEHERGFIGFKDMTSPPNQRDDYRCVDPMVWRHKPLSVRSFERQPTP